jgi:hypothetical protein
LELWVERWLAKIRFGPICHRVANLSTGSFGLPHMSGSDLSHDVRLKKEICHDK